MGIDIGLLVLFIALTIVNVILNTARTIITVKGSMFWSALISALAFGFYTVVIIYTVCELPMWMKVAITAGTNFVGVCIVKWVEEWMRKDKLWVIDVVLSDNHIWAAKSYMDARKIQFVETPISNSDSRLFHIYSTTQDESRTIKSMLSQFDAKYFVSESKHL